MISEGADINIQNNNCWSPIHVAIEHKFPEIFKLLLSKGAILNTSVKSQATPLTTALFVRKNNLFLLTYLNNKASFFLLLYKFCIKPSFVFLFPLIDGKL